ncbi:MAG: hypothetical protein NZ954_00990 [Thermofilaceae archaeon]|nr:hypothetical protein [Thermofilaceae archaeon]MCX8180242.1 hypothetical protein [Thermofilaceae archaeon]MDW8004038.1 hypothetical protein [Thermofilaceae archaeon]
MLDPFEILKTLHALSAVDEYRAIEVELLAKIIGVTPREIDDALKVLRGMDYVILNGPKVYLTELGIMKISSLFC